MTATRVTLLWSPRRLAPPNAAELLTVLERALPDVPITVILERDRFGWTVGHAGEGPVDGCPRPLEYKRHVVWALQRAGLFVRDCPICGDPVEIMGTEPRNFEIRTHGVAPDRTHMRYYAHRHATACTPLDLWARFTVRCACAAPLKFELAASESLDSGGDVACACGARYALEPRMTGGGLRISTGG